MTQMNPVGPSHHTPYFSRGMASQSISLDLGFELMTLGLVRVVGVLWVPTTALDRHTTFDLASSIPHWKRLASSRGSNQRPAMF